MMSNLTSNIKITKNTHNVCKMSFQANVVYLIHDLKIDPMRSVPHVKFFFLVTSLIFVHFQNCD